MRTLENKRAIDAQKINEVFILNGRDEMSDILFGLQYYLDENKNPQINNLLEMIRKDLLQGKSRGAGRTGMTAEIAFALLVARNGKMADYAWLEWILYNDRTFRALLGDSAFNPLPSYDETTIHQNLQKISKETIREFDKALLKLAVREGFEKGGKLRGDSFVCETNIHRPSENTLLYDCARVIIRWSLKISGEKLCKWQQCESLLKKIKANSRSIGISRRSKNSKKEPRIKKLYRELFDKMKYLIKKTFLDSRVNKSFLNMQISAELPVNPTKYDELALIIVIANKIMDMAHRRVFLNEKIENKEKILSIFEIHTELIIRGKYPVSIEFGHKIFLHQSESKFIIDYSVMKKSATDESMLTPSLIWIKENFKELIFDTGSYDKGFNAKEENVLLKSLLKNVVIAKRGKLTVEECEREHSADFIKIRLWRAGIESLISSLARGNGMALCPDKGLKNFEKFIGVCVLARNIQTFGAYLRQREAAKKQAA